jgi:hypothetical protein
MKFMHFLSFGAKNWVWKFYKVIFICTWNFTITYSTVWRKTRVLSVVQFILDSSCSSIHFYRVKAQNLAFVYRIWLGNKSYLFTFWCPSSRKGFWGKKKSQRSRVKVDVQNQGSKLQVIYLNLPLNFQFCELRSSFPPQISNSIGSLFVYIRFKLQQKLTVKWWTDSLKH